MTSRTDSGYTLRKNDAHFAITFTAMAGPCEVLVRCKKKSEADNLASLAFSETRRIERKFSRYRDDNIIHEINHSEGQPVRVDEELARLLTYADQASRLSEGMFDITSGVLHKAWKFDGSEAVPDNALIESLLKIVGWDKVEWDGASLKMLPGMEIDLGGVGKEYAVDRVAEMLFEKSQATVMVNFGGDIRAMTADEEPTPWTVGIEDPDREGVAVGQIDLTNGAVATSGDARRYCMVDGVRMGHILNPRTGRPVLGAPRSATVLGNYCVEAGFLATLSMLQGSDAEKFLKAQKAPSHLVW